MVSIEEDSTFALVSQANEVEITSDDLASWSKVDLADFTEDDELDNNMWVGLFGFDLTDFWTDCATASEYCPYDDLVDNYDGWAVGAYAAMSYDVALTTLA